MKLIKKLINRITEIAESNDSEFNVGKSGTEIKNAIVCISENRLQTR